MGKKGSDMAKTIAFVNQKGGVGKTTSCVNLAACLVRQGARVLVVDFDPQGNASSGLGLSGKGRTSIYDVLLGEAGASEAILPTEFGPLSLIPSSIELAGAVLHNIVVRAADETGKYKHQ